MESELKESKDKQEDAVKAYMLKVQSAHPHISLPPYEPKALLNFRVLEMRQDFWLGGRRLGLDTDASCHVIQENSPFIVRRWAIEPETVEGVGSMTLNERCRALIPLRMQNGHCAVLDLEAYVAPTENPMNLISVPTIHKEQGYKLVVGAAELFQLAVKPSWAVEGNARLSWRQALDCDSMASVIVSVGGTLIH